MSLERSADVRPSLLLHVRLAVCLTLSSRRRCFFSVLSHAKTRPFGGENSAQNSSTEGCIVEYTETCECCSIALYVDETSVREFELHLLLFVVTTIHNIQHVAINDALCPNVRTLTRVG